MTKAALRQSVRLRLAMMTPALRQAESFQVCNRARAQTLWQEAESLLLYAPMQGEVDIWPLVNEAVAEGKIVALPKFVPSARNYVASQIHDLDSDLVLGSFGIREPADHCSQIPLNQLDFILVPGIAFDLHGRRLGRGKGYYDQLLKDVRGHSCGVAFDQQIEPVIPVEPHDTLVNCILTPTRWLDL